MKDKQIFLRTYHLTLIVPRI